MFLYCACVYIYIKMNRYGMVWLKKRVWIVPDVWNEWVTDYRGLMRTRWDGMDHGDRGSRVGSGYGSGSYSLSRDRICIIYIHTIITYIISYYIVNIYIYMQIQIYILLTHHIHLHTCHVSSSVVSDPSAPFCRGTVSLEWPSKKNSLPMWFITTSWGQGGFN